MKTADVVGAVAAWCLLAWVTKKVAAYAAQEECTWCAPAIQVLSSARASACPACERVVALLN